jgi:threonine synthase
MKFISTRNSQISQSLSGAIFTGLAEDGGLFIPETFPQINLKYFAAGLSYPEFAEQTLKAFFKDDPLESQLLSICRNAFNFPMPLQTLNNNTFVLELFHGPTSSFKDFGARFLAECLNKISSTDKTTIMVATSGDTGSAVASAFYKKANVNVIILYPNKQVSERQAHQITCWGDNVIGLAVDGSFDDCQALVKAAFKDLWWQKEMKLSSANSINIGRLLPQMVYYAYSSMEFYERTQTAPGFIIPTGNLGNATAAYWAKQMGFPIREIVLATNANTTIPDYLKTGTYQPRPSVSTLANAMDVGNPSNFERLSSLFKSHEIFKNNVSAISVNDEAIKKTIKAIYQNNHMIICPHTATACFARNTLSDKPWIIVATADPCKFETVIEPLIDTKVPVAPALQSLLNRPTQIIEINKTLESIQKVLTAT